MNFTPGPANISEGVQKAFGSLPISHRSLTFREVFQTTKRLLCQLVKSRRVELLLGSGTLANDVIAAHLSLDRTRGLILSNGEFGNRLIDHATRFGLSFDVLEVNWGDAFERTEIESILDRASNVTWLWAVHCETSTGVLNDAAMLKELCKTRGARLCLDCIGSIGTIPLNLQDVYFASGVSGKGLGSYPGLSMVFYNQDAVLSPKRLPRYLDLGLYAASDGIPFTQSSNLLYALETALRRFDSNKPFDDLARLSFWLRGRLREMGFSLIASDRHSSPAVVTVSLPETLRSHDIGLRLQKDGYLLGYESEYLLKKNWVQICLMGECSQEAIESLLSVLSNLCIPAL